MNLAFSAKPIVMTEKTNLPTVQSTSTDVVLRKNKKLLALADKILAQSTARGLLIAEDDGWFERLCAWADQQVIEDLHWVDYTHPKYDGGLWMGLPRDRQALTQLAELDLFDNHLTCLPAEIGQLAQLTVLNLSSNQLTRLPAEIGQLTKLTKLELGWNKLTSLPAEIGQLTQLTELYLGVNELTSLPAEIGQLTRLTELYLFSNKLISLPVEVGQLTQLTQLHLGDSQLTQAQIAEVQTWLPNCRIQS